MRCSERLPVRSLGARPRDWSWWCTRNQTESGFVLNIHCVPIFVFLLSINHSETFLLLFIFFFFKRATSGLSLNLEDVPKSHDYYSYLWSGPDRYAGRCRTLRDWNNGFFIIKQSLVIYDRMEQWGCRGLFLFPILRQSRLLQELEATDINFRQSLTRARRHDAVMARGHFQLLQRGPSKLHFNCFAR